MTGLLALNTGSKRPIAAAQIGAAKQSCIYADCYASLVHTLPEQVHV